MRTMSVVIRVTFWFHERHACFYLSKMSNNEIYT